MGPLLFIFIAAPKFTTLVACCKHLMHYFWRLQSGHCYAQNVGTCLMGFQRNISALGSCIMYCLRIDALSPTTPITLAPLDTSRSHLMHWSELAWTPAKEALTEMPKVQTHSTCRCARAWMVSSWLHLNVHPHLVESTQQCFLQSAWWCSLHIHYNWNLDKNMHPSWHTIYTLQNLKKV